MINKTENDLNIRIVFELDNSRSIALIDNTIIGECEFTESDSKWVITHTGVREEYNGRGIARMLVECIVDEARKRNIKILPVCSYAKKLLSREEYQDIL